MIDISLGGLLGAIVGTALAAVIYAPAANVIERAYLARRSPSESKAVSIQERMLLRRGLLTFDLALCAGLGYWLGDKVVG